MKEKLVAAVLGGDERQSRLACILAERGFSTRVYGTDEGFCPETESSRENMTGVVRCDSAKKAVLGADIVIFPLPAVKNGAFLNEKSSSLTMVSDILDAVKDDARIFAGKAGAHFEELCQNRGVKFFDYYKSEPFTVKNAHLTAEGALYIFMSEKKRAVRGSEILVTGSGRVAKCTARVFDSLGAKVTMMARNKGELAWAEVMGYRAVDLENRIARVAVFSKEYDAIINTIPATFITDCSLDAIPEGTLYIELASAPYGIDIDEARLHGIEVIKAPSLPGKYAPESAAEVILEVIVSMITGKFKGTDYGETNHNDGSNSYGEIK